MLLTPADHTRLQALTQQATITPDDAAYIKRLINANCYIYDGICKFPYPVGDDGFPTDSNPHQWFKLAIRAPAKGGCGPNPQSLNAQQPWLDLGISRATWFLRRAAQTRTQELMREMPSWLEEAEGLKLYTLLASIAAHHTLDIKGLWAKVGRALERD